MPSKSLVISSASRARPKAFWKIKAFQQKASFQKPKKNIKTKKPFKKKKHILTSLMVFPPWCFIGPNQTTVPFPESPSERCVGRALITEMMAKKTPMEVLPSKTLSAKIASGCGGFSGLFFSNGWGGEGPTKNNEFFRVYLKEATFYWLCPFYLNVTHVGDKCSFDF